MSNPYAYHPPTIPQHGHPHPEYFPVYFPLQPSPSHVQTGLPFIPYAEPNYGVERHLVLQLLKSVGTRLHQGLQHVALLHPLTGTSGRCVVRDLSISLPTHILEISGGVYSPSTSTTNPGGVANTGLRLLLPCHGIVYAANCSQFGGASTKLIQPSSPRPTLDPQTNDSIIDLPVVKFQVPSCRTFMLVHEFLYTKRGDRFLFQLLDLPPMPPSQKLEFGQLVERMTSAAVGPGSSKLETLMERKTILKEVANNGYSLGIEDPEFWHYVNFAHQVVEQAIQAAQVGPSSS